MRYSTLLIASAAIFGSCVALSARASEFCENAIGNTAMVVMASELCLMDTTNEADNFIDLIDKICIDRVTDDEYEAYAFTGMSVQVDAYDKLGKSEYCDVIPDYLAEFLQMDLFE